MNTMTKRAKGYTLVETMAVLLVVCILYGYGAPNLRSFLVNQQVKDVARSLLTGAFEARSYAIAHNGNVGLVYSGMSWCIYDRRITNLTTCDTTTSELVPGELRKFVARAEPSVRVEVVPATAMQLSFNGLGRIVENITGDEKVLKFEVTAASDSNRTYRVDFEDGALRMCESTVSIPGDPRTC